MHNLSERNFCTYRAYTQNIFTTGQQCFAFKKSRCQSLLNQKELFVELHSIAFQISPTSQLLKECEPFLVRGFDPFHISGWSRLILAAIPMCFSTSARDGSAISTGFD
jgi:hypothetical protein